MTKTISKKISVKYLEPKPYGKTPPMDKILVINPEIRLYDIEAVDENEEG